MIENVTDKCAVEPQPPHSSRISQLEQGMEILLQRVSDLENGQRSIATDVGVDLPGSLYPKVDAIGVAGRRS